MDRDKAFSDSQLSRRRTSSSTLRANRYSLMSTVSDSIERMRGTYGSLDAAGPSTSFRTGQKSASCCVAGEHMLTSSSDEFRKSLSLNSLVHVDITDINGDGEAFIVPLSLRRCKKMILTPYTVILSIIGWRPWFKDSVVGCFCCWKIFNFLYPIIVILLMLYHFIFQIFSCQGKFNIHEDTKPEPDTTTTVAPVPLPSNCSVWDFFSCRCSLPYQKTGVISDAESISLGYCQHIVPTYVVPTLIHFFAFAYGFIHFRLNECEQLYSLMERVFLQAYSTPGVQNMLIRNSRVYLFSAAAWLFFQLGTEVLYNFAFSHDQIHLGGVIIDMASPFGYGLIVFKFIGMILAQCMNVVVVINYSMQCEMLIFHIKGICLWLHEKSIEINDAMHEILGARTFISTLNETMGKMIAFCVINFTELAIVGTALLFLNRNTNAKVLAYRGVFPLLWFAALLLPLIQAARLTRVGSKLRQISFETRVFGYQRCSQLELDSFVLFVSGATLRAKLFGVTIRPASIILTFGAAVFIVLTLMVVDLVSVSGYKVI